MKRASVAANPVLIGAATTLVVIVAVFLAYNANNGLPFVPTYQVHVNVPDAANLVTGNEVRIGGSRVGAISAIDPVVHRDGRVTARLTLKLDTEVDPLPQDSTVIVRPRSAVGLKFLELTRGDSREGIEEGGSLALANATPEPVEIDEFFNMFDARTREANRENLRIFGDALAGRGVDLNEAVQALDPLTLNVIPVMRNLSDPSTGLAEFFGALQRTASLVAPVAQEQGELFRGLSTTFDAFASIARPYLQETISGGPPALEAGLETLPFQRRFLDNSERLFAALRPGTEALVDTAPDLAEAFTVGTRTVERAPALNARLARTMRSLEAFAEDPQVPLGIAGLNATVRTLAPTLNNLASVQVSCSYVAITLHNAQKMMSDFDRSPTRHGAWIRMHPMAGAIGANSEGGPASAPAGSDGQVTGTFDDRPVNAIHSNPYPSVGAPGQNGVCMAGNERYQTGRVVFGDPSNGGTLPRATGPVPADRNEQVLAPFPEEGE